MPKKFRTKEEERLFRINEDFKKTDRNDNFLRDDHMSLRNQLDTFDLDTNLGYYRKHGTVDDSEVEELKELESEQRYKYNLLDKYDKYSESFTKLTASHQKVTSLLKEKIELDRAKKAQDALIEEAKKEGADLDLPPISTDVPELANSTKEFSTLLKETNALAKDIREYEKEENHKAFIKEDMKDFYADKAIKDEAKRKEQEKIEKEMQAKRDAEAKARKEKEEAEEREKKAADAHRTRETNIDYLKGEAGKINISNDHQQRIDSLFNEYKLNEKLNSDEKHPCHGFEKDATLKEAYDKYVELRYNIEKSNANDAKDKFNKESENSLNAAFTRGVGKINELMPDTETNLRVRAEKCENIIDYTARNIKYGENETDPQKCGELIGITHRLAQLHNQAEKPGFFSRLFNTKYNKAYNKEKNTIELYKEKLEKVGKFDPAFLDRITNKDTCYRPLTNEELVNAYRGVVHQKSPNDEIFKTDEDCKKIAENSAKMMMIKDSFDKKDPAHSLSESIKEIDEFNKAESAKEKEFNQKMSSLENEPQKENGKEELSEDRVKFEINELAPEKQGLEDNLEAENEGPDLSIDNPSIEK